MLSSYVLLFILFSSTNCLIPHFQAKISHVIRERQARDVYNPSDLYCNPDPSDQTVVEETCTYITDTFQSFSGNPTIHPNYFFYHNSYPPRLSSFDGYRHSQLNDTFPVASRVKRIDSYSPIQLGFESHCSSIYTLSFWENLFTYWMPKNCPRERGCSDRFMFPISSSSFSRSYFLCAPVIYTSPHLLKAYYYDISIPNLPTSPLSLFYSFIMSYPIRNDTFVVLCDYTDLCTLTSNYCLASRFSYDAYGRLVIPSAINFTHFGETVIVDHDDFSDCVARLSFKRTDVLDNIPIRFIPRNVTSFTQTPSLNYTVRMNRTHVLVISPNLAVVVRNVVSPVEYVIPVHNLYSGGPSAFIAVFSALSDSLLNLALKVLELYVPYIINLLNIFIERIYTTILILVRTFNYIQLPVPLFDVIPSVLLATTINVNTRAMVIYIAFSAIFSTMYPQ